MAGAHAIKVTINGERYERTVLAQELLVHFIRDTLGLRGTHIGCDTGNCGACTVRCDGRLIKSCMMLAVQADGCELTTVEGLAPPEAELTPLQQAFNTEHAVQCGYCTPGMVLAASYLLERNPDPSEHEIRRALKGNICRCTGYQNIVRAVRAAASGEVEVGV
ncbi:MAG TPA: (2Fe-2S)-binding protein [Solirubrobacteraceae bacterium]|nr:(2Fe-2S)-binding protein [Solirubrobacteraceae bacterium]